ncbi:MAG: hypothetical protein K0Q72_2094 [Armatimonadetes bacterium]|jgi:hypothetical protein|nr:hypothetical protein [Armatimonadota bacterium]
MKTTRRTLTALLILPALFVAGRAFSQEKAAPKKPEVAGAWTGTWELYSPPAPGAAPRKSLIPPMALEAKVEEMPGGKWQATFEGDAGGKYKYTIKMLGRQAGGIVLFQGTADLGEKDGGVYDWIGRANDKEFIGFYTSEGHTGTFRLTRPKPAAN